MSTQSLEERLTVVETKLEQLQRKKEQAKVIPWWEQIRGLFRDDPIYDEAMRLGREWRTSHNALDDENTAG